jgi:hypothetical protein
MRFAAHEMEYLGAARGEEVQDPSLARELGRRLEALRRYDQYFCDADWRPRRSPTRQASSKQPAE